MLFCSHFLKLEIQNVKRFRILGGKVMEGCRIAVQKKVIFLANFALLRRIFCIGATIHINREILCLPDAGFFFVI